MADGEDVKWGPRVGAPPFQSAGTGKTPMAAPKVKTSFEAKTKGMTEPGNIDLSRRPHVTNEDGSTSTVRSMSFQDKGREVLVPTVSDDARIMSDDEAIDTYRKTGKHLGKFDSPDNATSYAQRLHEQQVREPPTPTSTSNPASRLRRAYAKRGDDE